MHGVLDRLARLTRAPSRTTASHHFSIKEIAMQKPRVLGVVASSFLALVLSAGAGATMADHHSSNASQTGTNKNQTSQVAETKSGTEQANVGSSFGKGKGHDSKADQSNDASTSAKAKNANATKQSVDQSQWNRDGHGDQTGTNDNSTAQKAKAFAFTGQANIGGSNQSNDADTSAKSSNDNSTAQSVNQTQKSGHKDDHGKRCGCEDKGHKDDHGHGHKDDHGSKDDHGHSSQEGSNSNTTKQDAKSYASTEQVNIYAPITIFGNDYRGHSGGDVTQSNNADTKANSSNSNGTDQSVNQDQKGHGTQVGSNDNSTDQSAQSSAQTQQVNVYAPINVGGHGSSGNVQQGNTASTHASSSNSNGTSQAVSQN
jgi:hypothetical protein